MVSSISSQQKKFQSTLSVRRATWYYFIQTCDYVFQSTLSVRRATEDYVTAANDDPFQSTLSVRRATRRRRQHEPIADDISIHALREESDAILRFNQSLGYDFNPRSP